MDALIRKKPHKTKIKRTKNEKIIFTIVFILLLLYSLTFIVSYFFVFMNTFKSADEYLDTGKFALPQSFHFENYIKVFYSLEVNGTRYFGMVFNTLLFSLTGSIPALLSTAVSSYVCARYKFPGRRLIYLINIITITISLPGSEVAYFKLWNDLGFTNSWKYILGCFGGFGSHFIILYGFWKSVDWAYAEAAYMDGATDMKALFRVMLPQAFPIMGVFFILGFITSWTSYKFSMLYMPNFPTIGHGLFEYQYKTQRNMDVPMYFSALVITAIPSLILFGSFQDKIMTNMTIGGLKG